MSSFKEPQHLTYGIIYSSLLHAFYMEKNPKNEVAKSVPVRLWERKWVPSAEIERALADGWTFHLDGEE